MDKIVIIGSSGAGKSTFARKLGEVLAIEVIHLDLYFWKPGWIEHPRSRRIEIEQELINKKDSWIIEGTYLSSSDSRLNAADTIIFLDRPWHICLIQAFRRHFTHQGQPRPDIPEGSKDKLGLIYVVKIVLFPFRDKRSLKKKIKELQASDQAEKKTVLTLRSNEEAEKFFKDAADQIASKRLET